MTIDEKTRERRVATWTAKKTAWGAKLSAATNESDTAVAKLMLDEAEDALKRLGVNVKPEVIEEKTSKKRKTVLPAKKDKVSTEAYPSKAKDSADSTSTIGV